MLKNWKHNGEIFQWSWVYLNMVFRWLMWNVSFTWAKPLSLRLLVLPGSYFRVYNLYNYFIQYTLGLFCPLDKRWMSYCPRKLHLVRCVRYVIFGRIIPDGCGPTWSSTWTIVSTSVVTTITQFATVIRLTFRLSYKCLFHIKTNIDEQLQNGQKYTGS